MLRFKKELCMYVVNKVGFFLVFFEDQLCLKITHTHFYINILYNYKYIYV